MALPLAAGCAASKTPPPPPRLPAVRYVEPSDPEAIIALTPTGKAALIQRDRALQDYIRELRALLRE